MIDKLKIYFNANSNLKNNDHVTTLAWDIGKEISQILKFEGEIIICWDHQESGESLYNGAGSYGYGYDHSYCLVYRNTS